MSPAARSRGAHAFRTAVGGFAVIILIAGGLVAGRSLSRPDHVEVSIARPPPSAAAQPAVVKLAGKVRAPAPGRFYWGVFRDGAPYDTSRVSDLARRLGRHPSLWMWYQEWEGFPRFPIAEAAWLSERGIVPVVSWEPWRRPAIFGDLVVEQPKYRLSRIAAGAFDTYIKRYAGEIKSYGGPVMLRPFHEMDGFWYPWSGTVNGNTPAQYIAAWRHVRRLFDAVGAGNVTWVWSVNHVSVPHGASNDVHRYWPGDRYVDWIGISGFNWGNASPLSVWKGLPSVIGERYQELLRYRKPIGLMESGAPETGGDKAEWIEETFASLGKVFPRLAAAIWYDKRDSGLRDWRIDSSARASAAFRAAISRPNVLSADAAQATTVKDRLRVEPIIDPFSRRSSGAWGAVLGHVWDYIPTSGDSFDISVNGLRASAFAPAGAHKGIFLVGPASRGDVQVAATFTVDRQPPRGASNHFQVLLRAEDNASYYGFQLLPAVGEAPARLEIIRARNGVFTDLASVPAPFATTSGESYRILARARTTGDAIEVSMKAWPASRPVPQRWHLTFTDAEPSRIISGRAGVRLSVYDGPARITVDDFVLAPAGDDA